MSASPSPPLAASCYDDASLPQGQCRYILLNPEIKGQRCACVGFMLNRSVPGVSCQCGHLSCYHIKATVPPPDNSEYEQLQRDVQDLKDKLSRESGTGLGRELADAISRLSELETQVESNRDEASQDIIKCYQNVDQVWEAHERVKRMQSNHESRLLMIDERLDSHDDALHHLGDRLVDIDEAEMALEDRMEVLEESDHDHAEIPSPIGTQVADQGSKQSKSLKRITDQQQQITGVAQVALPPVAAISQSAHGDAMTASTDSWLVHISLLPTASRPFPFERNTNAYKRCLSRGLHQLVAVQGRDSDSFVSAVTQAFGSLLRGREWMPLQARLCDVAPIQGLPMLRPLDAKLIGSDYDMEFLQKHCAVCLPNGIMESLYIAMTEDTLSWHFLRRSPCSFKGLESCWDYDPLLDGLDTDRGFEDDCDDERDCDDDEEGRPSAGDIISPLQGNLKRKASEISRTASFGAADVTEGSRSKMQRPVCIQSPVEVRRRGVRTA
ncbi:hypothetical protein F5Y15DRAFT_419176 [Xylariaceae sp. FL0016]|nr:hypothetical protein F5Y15DRAFT_419176 [Xylariaceae sp. FL0016]